jgi:hypothetical protein
MRINKKDNKKVDITFCGTGSCNCPSIVLDKDVDHVMIGGEEEGWSKWTKEQFENMVNTIKSGVFDEHIK